MSRPMGPGTAFNPFSIHRVEPGAIAFVGEGEESLDAIVSRLESVGYSGQIVGPHGSGKSTLLVHLYREAIARGWAAAMFRARRERVAWPENKQDCPRVMFIDSAEQMPRWRWAWLRRAAKLRGVGLVVTTHRDLGLPLLHTRRVDEATLKQIVDSLVRDLTGPERARAQAAIDGVAAAGWERLLAERNGSLRDVLFALYDRYEGRDGASKSH